jgi:hypothetical protein
MGCVVASRIKNFRLQPVQQETEMSVKIVKTPRHWMMTRSRTSGQPAHTGESRGGRRMTWQQVESRRGTSKWEGCRRVAWTGLNDDLQLLQEEPFRLLAT